MLLTSLLVGQEYNNKIFDEESGKLILLGKTTRDAFKDTSFVNWFDEEYSLYQTSFKNKESLKEFLKECVQELKTRKEK